MSEVKKVLYQPVQPPPYQSPNQPGAGGYQGQPDYEERGFPPPGFPPPQNYQPGYPTHGQYGYGGPAVGRPTPASFEQRLVATLVDGILLSILFAIVITIGTVLIVSSLTNVVKDANDAVVSADVNGGTLALGLIIVILGIFSIYLPYYLILVGKGGTIGDRVAGIKIIDTNGNPPGYSKAFVRLLVQYFVSGIFLIGYLWVLWDQDKQTLHDKIAGTISVSAKNS